MNENTFVYYIEQFTSKLGSGSGDSIKGNTSWFLRGATLSPFKTRPSKVSSPDIEQKLSNTDGLGKKWIKNCDKSTLNY